MDKQKSALTISIIALIISIIALLLVLWLVESFQSFCLLVERLPRFAFLFQVAVERFFFLG